MRAARAGAAPCVVGCSGCIRVAAYLNLRSVAMELRFSREDEAFRREVADWLAAELAGDFSAVRGRGGPGDEHALTDERRAWERRLGAAGWSCIGFPREYGGRDATLTQQVIFYEEYARAGGPGRLRSEEHTSELQSLRHLVCRL